MNWGDHDPENLSVNLTHGRGKIALHCGKHRGCSWQVEALRGKKSNFLRKKSVWRFLKRVTKLNFFLRQPIHADGLYFRVRWNALNF